jgi:hypothetical protein
VQIAKPKLNLRSFFPETWLFSLELQDEGGRLERYYSGRLAVITCGLVEGMLLIFRQDIFSIE